jgi:hypothetical protein
MRTTLDIADDVLRAAKERARSENKTAGQVISELARKALTTTSSTRDAGTRAPKVHFGIRPFPRRGTIVTNELVDSLREEDAY